MQEPLSVSADWLSVFRTPPEPVQVLWLVVPLTVLATAWLVMRGLRQIAAARRPEDAGELVCGIYEDRDGRWMVYWRGEQPYPADRMSEPDLTVSGAGFGSLFPGRLQ